MNLPIAAPRLKRDLFGHIEFVAEAVPMRIRRDTRTAHPSLRWLARHLLRRERRALTYLAARQASLSPAIPQLLYADDLTLERSWIDGAPMHEAKPRDRRYFVDALRLLRRLHAEGVTHNDLAKEPNWLVTAAGGAAIVDFQLARCAPRGGLLFRALAHNDLRHLYKHKRTYCPEALTPRQRRLLAQPSMLSQAWRWAIKRPYLFVTRRLLGWQDREGRYERH